jgi:RNA-binding protein YhbY
MRACILVWLCLVAQCSSFTANLVGQQPHTTTSTATAASRDTAAAAEQALSLSGKDKRSLRALACNLKADASLCTLQLGGEATSGFYIQLEDSLRAFELVNIRTHTINKKAECKVLADQLAAETDATVVQVVGHTILLYRKRRAGEESGRASVDISAQLRMREQKAQRAAARNGLQF